MGTVWGGFKKFWSAEEIPRWFGLSLVLIYLVALGSVAHFGITQARLEGASMAVQTANYALRQLAKDVAHEFQTDPGTNPNQSAALVRKQLLEFANATQSRSVRLIDERGAIIASTDETEVGMSSTSATSASAKNSGRGQDSIQESEILRGLVPKLERSAAVGLGAELQNGDKSFPLAATTSRPHLIEVVLPSSPRGLHSLANQASALTVILLGLAVLFLIYRRLRQHMKPVTQIAQRLQWRREKLVEDLASLRVTDTIDGVSTAWNELVELAQRLSESVERTQANSELSAVLKRSSGGALQEALHAIPDAMIHMTDEVRIDYLNAAAGHLLGWNINDKERPALPEAKSSGVGKRVLDEIRSALQGEGNYEARTILLESENGTGNDTGAYRLWLVPVLRPGRQGECVVIIRDVSQQVRAERAREEFIAQVTHELRTPLTNIRAYAETLSSGMFDDPKVISECYNVITKETRRLSRLIEDVLSVSQFEVGSLELKVDHVDLKALLTESVRDVRGLADEKSIDIQLVLPAKMDPIRADRDKLAVVINNLFGNAIKYTKEGGNIVVGCQFAADNVVVTVKDNGIGIDPTDHQRVFEKFQRGSDPDALAETGTGIGLYTAREIVRGHGGDIELISQKGQGSTFMVKLPHQPGRAGAVATSEEK